MKKLITLFAILFSILINAQVGITVTSEIKSANADAFKNYTVNSIRQFGSIPKSFAGVSKNYQRTDGYHTLHDTIHFNDGFKTVVTPSFDIATQKLGAIFDQDSIFTFTVIAKTQQEQDDYQQQVDDNDASSSSIQQRKSDGEQDFLRAYSLIERRFNNGTITGSQAKALAHGLYPELNPLNQGLYRLVKDNLAATTPPANADLLAIFNLIKNGVDTYVTNNF